VNGKHFSRINSSFAALPARPVFESYLEFVFTYCGTYTVYSETTSVDLADVLPGDLLVQPGAPGYAMMVVDMAENSSGEKIFLLAQGFMPAQSIHIVKNPGNGQISLCYQFNSSIIQIPNWKFQSTQFRQWIE